jgi:hypothetical protein
MIVAALQSGRAFALKPAPTRTAALPVGARVHSALAMRTK